MAEESEAATQEEMPLIRLGTPQQRLRAVGDTLLVLLGLILGGAVLLAVAGDLTEAAGLTMETHPVPITAIETAVNFISFLAAGFLYLYWRDEWSLVKLRRPTLREGGIMMLGVIALAGVMQGMGRAFRAVGLEVAGNSFEVAQENPELYLVFIPMQFLLVAPAEEFIFRGILQGLFREAYGVVPGIVVPSVVFGLIHYTALAGESGIWPAIAIVIASAVLFGAIYEYTRNLTITIVIHGIWNAITFALRYVSETGGL